MRDRVSEDGKKLFRHECTILSDFYYYTRCNLFFEEVQGSRATGTSNLFEKLKDSIVLLIYYDIIVLYYY